MQTVHALIDKYAESHRNPANEVIHFVCVPAIAFSGLGLLWAVHPLVAVAGVLASLVYYFRLSKPFFVGMLAMSALMLALLALLPPQWVLGVSVAVFVIAWIVQFIGHKIEGKKPSFFEDIQFLLVGPIFVLGFLYRRLNVKY